MPHEDDDSLASTVGSVTRDRGSAGAGGGGDDDSDDSSESSAGGGGFGRSPSNPVGSTPSGGGGGSTGGDDDDDDDSSGRTPSGGPSPGAGGDPADDNPATGTDEPSGRTPGGGPSAGAGGDPSDDDPSFGGDPTDDPPAPGEPGGNEGIGDDGTDTGPTQAEQRQNQIDDAVTDFVSNNPFAQAAEDVVADIQDGTVQTQLSESARELQSQAQDIISNNPAADAIEDLNIDDGVSVRDQVQRSFERSQAIQERIAESRFADEASDVAASFQGSDVVTELTGEAAQAQQAVEETVTESRFVDDASEVVADVQDGDVVTELTGEAAQAQQAVEETVTESRFVDDASEVVADVQDGDVTTALTGEADDERALSETFADVDQDAQQSNPLQEEIDFTPGVEGDPVERVARGATEAFTEESAEAIDETSQQQIEALSELGLADRTDPQTFEQRFVDDFFEDTTTAAAQTPQNLVEAPEQLLGLGRDVTLTTGVGADSREDIEAAQARNRQRGSRLVRAATGTVENVRQDPAELGGVLGQAGLAVATGTGTGRTLSRATGDRVGGSDVSGRILLEAGRQTDQAVRETLDRVGLRQSLREPRRGGGTFRDDSGSGSGDGDDEPVTISGEDIQPRQLGGPEVTQDLDSDRSDIDAANPVQRRREQAQRDDAGRETVTGRLGDERPTTGDPRAERSNIDFSNLGPFDSDLDTDTRTDVDADVDAGARSPEVTPDGDADSLTPDVDSGGVFGRFDDAAAVGAGAAGASLVAEAEQRQEQAEAVLPGVDTRAATQPTFDVGDVDLGPDLDFETDTDTEGGVDITDRTDTDIDSRLDIDSRQDLDARQDIDVRQDTRQDLRQDTRQDTRQDVRQDVRQDIRQDLRQDLRVDDPDFPDDDDDDEPLFDGFEDETTGVRDVEATLEGVFDLPTGEEGGVFR